MTSGPSLNADQADFSFEVSPHTSRLHVYSNGKPLGLTLRADEAEGKTASTQLERDADDFQRAWKALSPYQQKLARGVAHKADVSIWVTVGLYGSISLSVHFLDS